jgi:hypothetical protein
MLTGASRAANASKSASNANKINYSKDMWQTASCADTDALIRPRFSAAEAAAVSCFAHLLN